MACYHPHKCLKCKEGVYSHYTLDKSYGFPESDTRKCTNCGHIVPFIISERDQVEGFGHVVKEEIKSIDVATIGGDLDKSIVQFTEFAKLCEPYFYVFLDAEYGSDDDNDRSKRYAYHGFRFENEEDTKKRLLKEEEDQKLKEANELLARKNRYARFLELKAKHG